MASKRCRVEDCRVKGTRSYITRITRICLPAQLTVCSIPIRIFCELRRRYLIEKMATQKTGSRRTRRGWRTWCAVVAPVSASSFAGGGVAIAQGVQAGGERTALEFQFGAGSARCFDRAARCGSVAARAPATCSGARE